MTQTWRSLMVLLAVVATGIACSDDDSEPEAEVADPPALRDLPTDGTVVEGPDDSPFCRAMLEVGTVEGDGLARPGDEATGGDGLDDLVALYVDVADEVPAEIRPDFDVVLERLVTVAAGDEVTDPERADQSASELAAFIERQCRGTSISPLPPPTVPGAPVTDDD